MTPKSHPDAGRGKAGVPADPLAEKAAHQRRDEGAEVDPHVVDREAGVAPFIAVRVQLADEHADVAFEQTRADHDQHQAEVERGDGRERPC